MINMNRKEILNKLRAIFLTLLIGIFVVGAWMGISTKILGFLFLIIMFFIIIFCI